MKVLFVLPTLGVGGMERAATNLANIMVAEKVEVAFFLCAKKSHFYNLDSTINIFEPNRGNALLSTFRNVIRYRKVCKEWKPNAVLSYGQTSNILCLIANLGTNNRLFISDRGNPLIYSKKISHRFIRWFGSKYLTGIIQQSQKAKDIALKEMRCKNVAVIGNPILPLDNSLLSNARRENIVISVGRFIKTKNFDTMIQWFSELPTNWKLVIVGGDFQYERCRELVSQLNMEDRILLVGKQSNVKEYLLKSKVFAFTSTSEGFPNVIGEALAAGLPVVSFDCMAGPSEMIINGYNGFLVDDFDKEGFCNALLRLMNNEAEREKMSINAIESIKRFDSRIITKQTLDFLSKDTSTD